MRMPSMQGKQRGQGMTEYIIIVALIAVAAIAVTQLFGATIRNQMAGISAEISGSATGGAVAVTAAQNAATKAGTEAKADRNLTTYTGNVAKGVQ
jgi:type IV pilus assembly protein PilA